MGTRCGVGDGEPTRVGRTIVVRAVRWIIWPVWLLCLGTSCSYWSEQWITPERAVSREKPDRVQVTLTDSSRVVMDTPSVVEDSLVGFIDDQRTALPLTAVAFVSMRRGDPVLLMTLVPILAAIGLVALLAITW